MESVEPAPAASWRVLDEDARADLMMDDYHRERAAERVAALRAQFPPERLARSAASVRRALAATYRMPPSAGAPQARVLRTVTVDGIPVEQRLLRIREGVYSTALVFLPAGEGRHPALLMLPGHGDPSWSPAVHSRCLAFARRGYLVMLVQPFGQNERGENSLWNEYHGSLATATLLTTGQSLLGRIMADHQAELTDLCARPEVDPRRVAVTGVSMGGTHTLWFAAIDTRVRAAAGVAVAPLTCPNTSLRHHCLCDLMVGLYRVADEEMIQALAAPRALLRIYPGGEVPLSDEGVRLLAERRISHEEALRRYGLDEAGLRQRHQYAHQTFRAAGAPEAFSARVVPGPHDYTPAMREVAAEWFARHLGGDPASVPEPPLTPLAAHDEGVALLNFWPKGDRPAEILGPTAYVQQEVARLIDRLPAAPDSLAEWRPLRSRLRDRVRRLLGVSLASPDAATTVVGAARAESASFQKLVVRPEPDILLPMLLFAPAEGTRPDGRLVVLLSPQGKAATADTARRQQLTRAGAWVLCVDLRGMGETRFSGESGAYLGFRDVDTCMGALKLGHTLAGYWVKDLLAAIQAAVILVGGKPRVEVHGELETGLVAILAAGQSRTIAAVETEGLLASYASPRGYGQPYAYADEHDRPVGPRPSLGGYGSLVPCIPDMLKHADIPQLAALVAPRPLTVTAPLWASGDPLSPAEAAAAFAWTRAIYRLNEAEAALRVQGKDQLPA